MPRHIKNSDQQKWQVYLTGNQTKNAPSIFTEESIRQHLAALQGQPVASNSSRARAVIGDLRGKGVLLRLPNGKLHPCPLSEIINADLVIRYWVRKGMIPTCVTDFRKPHEEIGVSPIHNNYYGPTLAIRLRKEQGSNQFSGRVKIQKDNRGIDELSAEGEIGPMSRTQAEGLIDVKPVKSQRILRGKMTKKSALVNGPNGEIVKVKFLSAYSEPNRPGF